MASQTITLSNIPQGWYMSWSMTTQAAFNVCVTLKDSSTTYVDNECRQSTTILPPLAQGFQQVVGTGLTLEVDVAESSSIKVVNQPYAVPDNAGNVVGQGYTILMEDGTDDDFNDLFVSVIAWKSEG